MIHIGDTVDVVLKQDQHTGKLTRGVVKDLLTGSQFHPHGIKVRLADGQVGRVKAVIAKKANPGRDARPPQQNERSSRLPAGDEPNVGNRQ